MQVNGRGWKCHCTIIILLITLYVELYAVVVHFQLIIHFVMLSLQALQQAKDSLKWTLLK